MIKFIFIVFFIRLIFLSNNFIIFFYNLCYLIGFLIIFMYIYKDLLWLIIRGNFGIDYYSIWLLILRLWIIGLIYICLSSGENIKIINFLILLLLLLIFFLSLDLILFYFLFEVRLIPTFLIIIYWGRNPERLRASFYLIIYILLISFPLLVYIFKINLFSLTIKFSLIELIINIYEFRFWEYLIIYLAFFIKIPIYIFHIWLPKAHVEAPVYGSIILAGILLKIGRYGLIRLLRILVKRRLKFNYLFFSLRLIGRLLVRIICLIQIDMKRLVAYSSVVHINIILCSLITLFKMGFLRRYILIISHGLCSSGLFYIVNIYYRRTFSRLLILNKGMIGNLSIIAFWWFILCISNFSYPFSLNFIREIFILGTILNWEIRLIIYLMLICFLRRAYSLYLFAYIQHRGDIYHEKKYNIRRVKEFIVVILHCFPLFLFLFNLLIFI